MPPERAQAAGLALYGYAFWVILFGIVLTAAGLHHALVHPTEELTWEYAGQLCVGVGLFWVGLGLFRLTLHLAGAWPRILGGVLLGALIVVGVEASGARRTGVSPARLRGAGAAGAAPLTRRTGVTSPATSAPPRGTSVACQGLQRPRSDGIPGSPGIPTTTTQDAERPRTGVRGRSGEASDHATPRITW